MTKSWLYFYLIIGGMTVAGIVQPGLIVLGFFVFILPGLAMALAPSVLIYGILLHVCLYATKGRRTPVRRGIAAAVIGAVAVGPVMLLNERERREEAVLTAGDSPAPVEAPQARSITIVQNRADPFWQGGGLDRERRSAGTRCGDLCLRRDCRESCAWGHTDADGGRIWQSRRTYWISFWQGVIRRTFSPRMACSTI